METKNVFNQELEEDATDLRVVDVRFCFWRR